MSLSSRLNNKIDVYAKTLTTNELGEKDYAYAYSKSVWAEIVPGSGSVKSSQANSRYASISHTVTVRPEAIPNLCNDMYFIFKGQRYDITYFNPNYKFRDSVEIFCELVIE